MSIQSIPQSHLRQQFLTDLHHLLSFSQNIDALCKILFPSERKVGDWIVHQLIKHGRIQISQELVAHRHGVSISTVKSIYRYLRLTSMITSYRWFKQTSAHTLGIFFKNFKDYDKLCALFPSLTTLKDLYFKKLILDKQSNCPTISSYSSSFFKNSLSRNINVDVRKSSVPQAVGNFIQKLLGSEIKERDDGNMNQNYLKQENQAQLAPWPSFSQSQPEREIMPDKELLIKLKRACQNKLAAQDSYDKYHQDEALRRVQFYDREIEKFEKRLEQRKAQENHYDKDDWK